MHRDRRILVVVESAHPGGRPDRCRYCRARIVWFTSSPKGKPVPFNPNPLVLSRSENPDTRVKFDMLSPADLHFLTCTNKPRRIASPPTIGVRG